MHSILEYIFSHAHNDKRPYIEISILGNKFLGLLDSGATQTFVNEMGWEKLRSLDSCLENHNKFTCTVGNGELIYSVGTCYVPMKLENQEKLVKVVFIPNLNHMLICGIDFWRIMKIIPN